MKNFALRGVYPNHPEHLLIVFDLAEPDGAASLERHRAAFGDHASIEPLSEHIFVLTIVPGWAGRPAK